MFNEQPAFVLIEVLGFDDAGESGADRVEDVQFKPSGQGFIADEEQ